MARHEKFGQEGVKKIVDTLAFHGSGFKAVKALVEQKRAETIAREKQEADRQVQFATRRPITQAWIAPPKDIKNTRQELDELFDRAVARANQ